MGTGGFPSGIVTRYRSRIVVEPRTVLREMGLQLDESTEIECGFERRDSIILSCPNSRLKQLACPSTN